MIIDRRALLTTGLLGLGGLVLPAGRLAAQALLGATGFTHNVASGEPQPDSVLLWTRYKPAGGGPAKVRAEIAADAAFTRVVDGAEMVTGPWRDHTVKITLAGLEPGTRYYYRFIAPDGSRSPIGRTKTLPAGRASRFAFAIFSCSNLGFGEFNAYGHAAARDDVDATLHLGDYIYEYNAAGYSGGAEFARRILPDAELLTLADYRLRYAAYRSDPQLQALHAAHPMIVNTDDHESANDSWEGGAQNHQPDEGDWTNRKNAAMQVWREWQPVGEQPWALYPIGDLATYYRTDTRTVARSRPREWSEVQRGNDVAKALTEFRDGPWQDQAATMFGTEQEAWLFRALQRDRAAWQVVASGTNVGYTAPPESALAWLPADAAERAKSYTRAGIAAGKAGLPYNLDNWGGYPAAKRRFLGAAQRADADLVVVTGDSHNAWAFDLKNDGRSAGVEFGGHSVTSPGFENSTKGTDPLRIAREMVAANPSELRWMDASNRGYMHLELTPSAATNSYVFMDTIKTVSLATKPAHRMRVRRGRKVLEAA